jgi:hypothetical protein
MGEFSHVRSPTCWSILLASESQTKDQRAAKEDKKKAEKPTPARARKRA